MASVLMKMNCLTSMAFREPLFEKHCSGLPSLALLNIYRAEVRLFVHQVSANLLKCLK